MSNFRLGFPTKPQELQLQQGTRGTSLCLPYVMHMYHFVGYVLG